MPETNPPPDLAGLSLAEIATLAAEKKLPPVDRWNPAQKGDSEMRIASDGSWFHQGARIGRPAMVRLFASILRREPDDSYVLVTPVEKLSITVDDAPFVAVEMKSEGKGAERRIAFRLNTDELVAADADHPLHIESREDGPRPYILLRNGIEALVARSVYYELVNMAVDEGADPVGLWSAGTFFPLGEP
jgi:hypothetical protein